MACWLQQLEEYDFEIVHRQGKLHHNADAMSRLPYMNCQSDNPDVSIVANTVNREIFDGNKFSRLAESTKN